MLKLARQQLQLFAETADAQGETVGAGVLNGAANVGDHSVGQLSQRPFARNLWLCIRFPKLALEAVGSMHAVPSAVFTDERGSPVVYACNNRAADAGITSGIALNSALALLPELDIRQRQPQAEHRLLQSLANWALNYTPVVSLDLTGALLLEVRGSLHLFGGLGAMRARLADELQSWGHCAVMASAPTAKAASWLARADMEIDCTAIHALPGVLRNLPLACLDWPINVQHQLLQMGVSLLADCVRLPRDGFARRIGPAYLQDLDQGFGRYPELLHYYQPAAVFDARLDLGADIQSVDDIATGLEELFDRLAAFLRQRQAGVRQLQVKLFHHRRSPTVLVIKVHEVCASATHCMELCRLQLDRLTIPAPVTGLSLRTEAAVTHDFSDDDLLRRIPLAKVVAGHGEVSSGRINRFIEQLRARLGSGRVYVPHVVAEHRPEYAWHAAEPCSSRFSPVPGELVNRLRPLWLLQQPLPLESRCNRPVQHGAIIPLGDAERIESGWWDGLDIRRDYYRTANRLGVRLWIYRDCRNSAWYLHGLFA